MHCPAEVGSAVRLNGELNELMRPVGNAPPGHPYDVNVFTRTGTPAFEKFVAGAQGSERIALQGDVLLVGSLAVPRETGRDAPARHNAWVSACPLDSSLYSRVLEVPPVELLNAEDAVGISVAISSRRPRYRRGQRPARSTWRRSSRSRRKSSGGEAAGGGVRADAAARGCGDGEQ
jgi:hypothetical protein